MRWTRTSTALPPVSGPPRYETVLGAWRRGDGWVYGPVDWTGTLWVTHFDQPAQKVTAPEHWALFTPPETGP